MLLIEVCCLMLLSLPHCAVPSYGDFILTRLRHDQGGNLDSEFVPWEERRGSSAAGNTAGSPRRCCAWLPLLYNIDTRSLMRDVLQLKDRSGSR